MPADRQSSASTPSITTPPQCPRSASPPRLSLRNGLNPHQRPAAAEPVTAGRWPLRVVAGSPSYINLLDAIAAWRLVWEATTVLRVPAAASFKHVSPAGAAIDGPVDQRTAQTFGVDPSALSPVSRAYVRARDADPRSSYGDVVGVSAPVDIPLAKLLRRVVSDAIIAPGFEPGTLEILAAKKHGRYLVLEADPGFEPPDTEVREVFGLRLVQPFDGTLPEPTLVATGVDGTRLPAAAVRDLQLGLVVLKHTTSNSVAYVRDGMTLGIGAGQQSRIDCTELAGAKVDGWWTRRPELVPTRDVAYVSDGMLPFRDNVDEAARHGVAWIAEPGGSVRSDEVEQACRQHGITLVRTGRRLFQH